jgi:hypothetical protein
MQASKKMVPEMEPIMIEEDDSDVPNLIILDEVSQSTVVKEEEEMKETVPVKNLHFFEKDIEAKSTVRQGIRDAKDYAKLDMIPVYFPSHQEFEHPMRLIEKLKSYEKYGAVVIRAPSSFRPICMFDYIDKKVTTRVQVLQNLVKGRVTFAR